MKSTMEEFVEILRKCDNATFFHTPMWLDAVKHFWGMEWFYDQKRIGNTDVLMPISIYEDSVEKYYFSTFKGYGGILTTEQILDEEEYLELEREFFIKYSNFKTRDNPLSPWHSTISSNSMIDIGYIVNRNDKREQCRSHRRKVAIAIKNNIVCRRAQSNEWNVFYQNCYLSTVSSWKNPSIVYSYQFFDYLHQFDGVELYVAEVSGKIIAGIISLSFGKHTHLWLSGINNENKHMEPIYLLINNMIDYLLPSETVFVDLGVSGRNDNLLFFKRGFGGEKYESIQYETSPNFGELKKKLVRNCSQVNQVL